MNLTITPRLFEAFLKCPTKCFLRSIGEVGDENSYGIWVHNQNDCYREQGIKTLVGRVTLEELVFGPFEKVDLKRARWRMAVNLIVHAGDLESCIHAVEKIISEDGCTPVKFIPIRFNFAGLTTRS